MRLTTPAGLVVVKKEEKEGKLSQFIDKHLDARRAADTREPACFLLVARSAESPVVRALAARSAALEAHGIVVRAVLTLIDQTEFGEPSLPPGRLIAEGMLRLVADARLYEAHEQLVMDGQTCWIGDCMRREPAKRDSYERFAEGCAETAKLTARAFDRLWSSGISGDHMIGADVIQIAADPTIDPASLPEAAASQTATISTRH
ncbi:MAG: hypothetical protein NW217_02385 [Hyphomicrobiaceae bacterium]|nr:hypothetical protein [Hyphomicrobiaceae bacterium]